LSPRHYRERIQDILNEIEKIHQFTDSMDYSVYIQDEKTQHAVQMSLIIIGEAGNSIPEAIQEEFLSVPWNLIRAMRNRLVHTYFNFDNQMIWDTIKKDIPILEIALRDSGL
jgi:uncharacterized protein with HEPN domain